ncbi:hypothetical protein J3F83DRAFT_710907 [Trichoderma novae-zelandiae]
MDAAGQEKGALAWTDDAKFQFLLRIVAQLKEDGRSIKWDLINIPGRTPKSLKNMWTKINKQISELEALEKSGECPATPVKPRRRGRPPKNAFPLADQGLDDDDENLMLKQKLLKKRGAEDIGDEQPGAGKKKTKVKPEAMADDAMRFKDEQI